MTRPLKDPPPAVACAKGGNAVRWHREPCPAVLDFGGSGQVDMLARTFACQRPATWAGDTQRAHLLHIWRGQVDGKRVELSWSDGGS
jgi:hypothetical protein